MAIQPAAARKGPNGMGWPRPCRPATMSSTPIPFGPYLATAGVIAMYWGEPITRHYLQILYY